MNKTYTLTTNGRITIPRDVQILLGLVIGDKISFEMIPNERAIRLKRFQRTI